MGADNWAYCPQCRVKAIKAKEKLYDKADKAYGKKPASEYTAMLSEAEQPIKLDQTLREDYGIGVGIDGIFGVNYTASCTACDFRFEYNKGDIRAVDIAEDYVQDAENDNPFGYNYKRPFRFDGADY